LTVSAEPFLQSLADHGAVLFRGFDVTLDSFSAFVKSVSKGTSIDPAREFFAPNVQLVDAGTDAVGLHCENGATPHVPDVVWFFCAVAPQVGSRTTLCDGYEVWVRLSCPVRELFLAHEVIYSRSVPEDFWVSYLRHEYPGLPEGRLIHQDLLDGLSLDMQGTRMVLGPDRNLTVHVKAPMVHPTRFGSRLAWANSLLGPSYNYQAPAITLDDGAPVPAWALDEIQEVTEACICEIPWTDGDVVAIDNTRSMHGRRAILDPKRRLFTALSYV
jgi:hypothetical protein